MTGTSTLTQSCLPTVHSSKYTHFFLMYSRQATLPIDILTDQQKTTPTNSKVQMTDEQIHEKARQLIDLRKKALENVNNAKEKMKKRADAKHSDFTSKFTVGSLVLVRIQGGSPEKEARWNHSGTVLTE